MVATPEQDPLSLTLGRQLSSLVIFIWIFHNKLPPRTQAPLAKRTRPQELFAHLRYQLLQLLRQHLFSSLGETLDQMKLPKIAPFLIEKTKFSQFLSVLKIFFFSNFFLNLIASLLWKTRTFWHVHQHPTELSSVMLKTRRDWPTGETTNQQTTDRLTRRPTQRSCNWLAPV